jgi:tetratricopeptide (TPR) repeat protein
MREASAADAGAVSPAAARASALLLAASYVGDFAAARALVEQAVDIWQRLGDRYAVAHALLRLGQLARDRGEYTAARTSLEESLALARDLADPLGVGQALQRLGTVAHARHDLEAARSLYAAALVAFGEVGDRALEAWPRLDLGFLALAAGDLHAARAQAAEFLVIRREQGGRVSLVHVLALCAALAAAERRPERALRLDAAIEAVLRTPPPRERITRLGPVYRAQLYPWLDGARRALGDAAAAAARAEGAAMTAAQAMAEVTTYLATAPAGHEELLASAP